MEHHGEAVVRFDPECGLAGDVCRCRSSAGLPRIPLGRLTGSAGLQVGDSVAVELASGRLTGAALLVFGLPLAALLAGAWLGAQSAVWLGFPVGGFPADIAAALAGLMGLAVSLLLAVGPAAAALRCANLAVHREVRWERKVR